jgi:signal peptidase I
VGDRRSRLTRPRFGTVVTALAVTAVVAVGLGSATGVVPFELVRIPSDSMAPTLEPGDHVVLDHRGRAVSRGDLVVVPDPQDGTLIVKRVVAVGGDMVGISDGVLEVDGRAVDEPYADRSLENGVYYGPYPVPDGRLFLLGDHRAVSVDSRAFGPVPATDVVGTVDVRVWPRPGSLDEPAR